MSVCYFEDIPEGAVYWSPPFVVDREEMLAYSRLNDPWPFHIDSEAARASHFGDVIASGGYIITLMYRSCHTIYNKANEPWAFLGGFDWTVKFRMPVKAGDVLRNRTTVFDKRLSSKPGRGLAKFRHELVNEANESVFVLEAVAMLATRPKSNV
jgi:acyl dehydratase